MSHNRIRLRNFHRLIEAVARLRRRSSSDEGFGMVEVVVAMAILGIVLTSLSATLVNSVRPVMLSKQRAVATAATQQLLEQARSLKYSDVGMVSTDTTLPQNGGTDSNITCVGGTGPTCTGGAWTFGGEALAYATNVANHPFNPHYVASYTTNPANPTTLTRLVWVTQAGNLRRVTVRVQWGNPAIAGRDNFVRASTLISNSAFTQASTPLTSATTSDLGSITLGSVAGSTADAITVTPGSSCQTDCGVASLGLRNEVTCSGRTMNLDHSSVAGGSTFGGSTVSTLADDDPSTAAPQTQGPTTVSGPAGSPPADIMTLLTQPSIGGSTTCLSTVLGTDAATGGATDLPYESGSTTGPATVTLTKNVTAIVPAVPTAVTLMSRVANVGAEAQTTNTMNPSTTIVSSATARTADTSVLGLTMPTASPAIAASNGIVRAEMVTATATATGTSSGTPASPSISSATLRVWIYDPLNQLPGATCTSRSLGYCVVDHNVSSTTPMTPISLDETIGVPIVGPKLRFVVSITEGAATTVTQTGSRGTTWLAQVKPLVATVGLCISNGLATCTPNGTADPATKLVDLSAKLDLGSIKAQVTYGYPV